MKEEIDLVKWLTCDSELLKEFSKEEIAEAIKEAKYTIDDLTDKDDFEHEPQHIKQKELVETWHTSSVKRYMIYQGKQWETTELAKVQTYRVKACYQGLKHNKIIFNLLKNRLSWFPKFKWDIYGFTFGKLENYEIYIHTKKGALYVPILALIHKKPDLITNRMKTYFTWYYKNKPEYLKQSLSILETKKAKQLLALLVKEK